MKYLPAFALSALVAAASAPAVAQTPPPRPTPNPAMRQQFQQMRSQMEQIRQTERSQILNALTPAHKSLLATTAGELATSVNPDYRAAANRLDAALSAGEKQQIVNAAQNARTQMRSAMESMRANMPAPPEGGGPQREGGMMRGGSGRTPTAGEILLRLSTPGPGMGFGMMQRGPRHR